MVSWQKVREKTWTTQRQNTPNRQMGLKKAINRLSSRHLYRPSLPPHNRSNSTTSSPTNSIAIHSPSFSPRCISFPMRRCYYTYHYYYYSILNRYAAGCSLAVCKVGCPRHDKVAALNIIESHVKNVNSILGFFLNVFSTLLLPFA